MMLLLCSPAFSDYSSGTFTPARLRALGGSGVALKEISRPLTVNSASMASRDEPLLSLFYSGRGVRSYAAAAEYSYPFLSRAALGAGARVDYISSSSYKINYLFGAAFSFIKNGSMGISVSAITGYENGEEREAFSFDSALSLYPYPWLGIGAAGINLINLEQNGGNDFLTSLKAGLSLINSEYIRLVSDLYIDDILEEKSERDIMFSGGVEISPHKAFFLRAGSDEGCWSMGLGLESKNIIFDYAYIPEEELHFAEAGIRFSKSPSRKEAELDRKSLKLEKDMFYMEAVRDFSAGRMAAARRKAEQYKEKYGYDSRIRDLESDISQWLEKVRQEKMGRARELEKEILKAYYRENIEKAVILMDNLELIAPNYEEALYLRHLLNARLLLEKGEYEQAEDELVEALKINPDSEDVRALHRRLREVLRLDRR